MNNLTDAKAYFLNIYNKYGKFERLYKLFQSKYKKYFYDVGTGKIFECSEFEYDFFDFLLKQDNQNVFEDIFSNLKINEIEEIYKLIREIESFHLLQAPSVIKFNRKVSYMLEKTENELQQITLELTESCNLNCQYCIYRDNNIDFREFGKRRMNWDIAKKAIDYGLLHSNKSIALSFYGGEPLLEFELLKKCVNYILKNKRDKRVIFSVTTNLTLATPSIANFFSNVPNFSVVGSLDGYEKIHNKNRIYKDGRGSYTNAILGLKNLVEAFGMSAKDNISLSMVLDMPTQNIIENIQNFFNTLEWLPQEVVKRISYVRPSSNKEISELAKGEGGYSEPVGQWGIEQIIHKNKRHLFTDSFVEKMLLPIHNRILVETPIQECYLNGCCYPGSRRMYINTIGDFYVCERIGKSPKIGNVYQELDKEVLIKEYLYNYEKESILECNKCWAINMCEVCFMECYDEFGFNKEKKNMACTRFKKFLETNLSTYFSILEEKPEIIKDLDKIIIE